MEINATTRLAAAYLSDRAYDFFLAKFDLRHVDVKMSDVKTKAQKKGWFKDTFTAEEVEDPSFKEGIMDAAGTQQTDLDNDGLHYGQLLLKK